MARVPNQSAPLHYLDELRPAFVAHIADRLNNVICEETQAYADRIGIRTPVKSHSAILFLHKRGPASLSEIARCDGQSHQLLAARLDPLESLGLIERFEDPEDRRRRPYRLTRSGREEAKRVEAAAVVGAEAMRRLFQEIDEDLIAALEKAIERLRVQPFGERMREVEAGGTRGRARK